MLPADERGALHSPQAIRDRAAREPLVGRQRLDNLSRRLGRADSERREHAAAQIAVRCERSASIAGGGEASEEIAMGLLGQWVESRAPPGEIGSACEIAFLGRLLDEPSEELARALAVALAGLIDPIALHTGEQLSVRERQRLIVSAGRNEGLELTDIHPQAVSREADAVTRSHEQVGRGAELPPERPQRATQARKRARVEHIRPEAGRDGTTSVHLRRQRQPREKGGGTIEAGGRPVLSVHLDLELPDQRHAEHQASERTSVTKR